VHATNISGLGATQLVQSLLPAIEKMDDYDIRIIYLPACGPLSTYLPHGNSTRTVRRQRRLPNAISRALECTFFASRFEGEGSLLVLGDIPLRCKGRQVVFVQTPLLTSSAAGTGRLGAIKFRIARWLFALNAKYASAFIVQSEAMKQALLETYPQVAGRIHVILQPPPRWLVDSALKRTGPASQTASGLNLFYPAAFYPHKNHRLLGRIGVAAGTRLPVSSLTLTIEPDLHPNSAQRWIQCVGRLGPDDVLRVYQSTDGLLFLSRSESLGFPLVEAMWIGLPIVCPDLPYARVLCGDEAIYFDPTDPESLYAAVTTLKNKLEARWWPDWSSQVKAIPRSWDVVAASMLQVTAGNDPA
jgi:glycosyltransferase involved in cell wall biosynthesis